MMHAALPTPPFSDPVLIFALAMVVFLVAPLALERFKVPGLIGLILAGVLLGPHGFHLLELDSTIELLGTVGLLYLMFLAGEEIDLHGFRRYRGKSVGFGIMTFLLPQVVGAGAGLLLGMSLPSAILLGAVLASHTLLAYPLTLRLGLGKQRAVTIAVGGTMIADTTALLVLSIVAAAAHGRLDLLFWIRLGASLTALVGVIVFGLPRLARWFFRHERTGSPTTFVFILAALFSGAYLAHLAGVEPIVGAFLVGLALNRLIPAQGLLTNRIHFVGDAFFIPFFMLFVGMLIDVRVFTAGLRAWLIMGTMVVVALVTKWLAAWIAERTFGYESEERWVLFGLSAPRASATLAIALVGYELGLFDDVVQNGVIVLILITSFVGPWVVERYGRRLALHEERRASTPAETPRRVLISLSNPETAGALVDLGVLLRERSSPDPLSVLTVVPEDGGRAEEHVASAEKLLSRAVAYAAGADVPVQPLTRVDQNFATGIQRGIVETRTTTVIVGWEGRASRQRVFGGVLDQLLEQSRQLVVVAKLGHPLNITDRVVVVIPPGADHAVGFADAIRVVTALPSRLGAELRGLVVEGAAEPYADRFRLAAPDLPVRFERVPGWDDLLPALRDRVRETDLVVLLGARRGTVAWHPALERLPVRLAALAPGSFVVVYPPESVEIPSARIVPPLARALDRSHVRVPVPGTSAERAVKALLRTAFPEDRRRVRALLHALLEARGGAIEIAPGVVIPHARIDDLKEPLLLLGVSREGVRFAGVTAPARLIFLVLSPADQPDAHLALLAEVAKLVASPERVAAMRDAANAGDVMAVVGASGLTGSPAGYPAR